MKSLTTLALCLLVQVCTAQTPTIKEMYELRVYELSGGGTVTSLEKYLSQALIPALNRNGVSTVGVFRETGSQSRQRCMC